MQLGRLGVGTAFRAIGEENGADHVAAQALGEPGIPRRSCSALATALIA